MLFYRYKNIFIQPFGLVSQGEQVKLNRRRICDECSFREHPVVIVGSQRFCIDVLGNFINANTPAQWSMVDNFQDIPRPEQRADNLWRLIFADCIGMENSDILLRIKEEAAPYLSSDMVALFNLKRDKINLPQLLALGVRGFFFETDQASTLLKGICTLKRGELWVTRGALMEYVCQRPGKAPTVDHAASCLTAREKEVLRLLTSGATSEEIANHLFVSPHTVKTHLHNTLKKLGLQNRLQAALWAAKHLE